MIHVLGAGPAGMLAAHAASLHGEPFQIHSIKRQSPIWGATYLHHAIPELTTPKADREIRYSKMGDRAGYAQKIYGDPEAPCSWDRFDGTVPAWDLERHYETLWDWYHRYIVDEEIRHDRVAELLQDGPVFSTITPQGYCTDPLGEHLFEWQEVRIAAEGSGAAEGEIIYNGDLADPWYRTSTLFEFESTEFPGKYPVRDMKTQQVRKPLKTNCDCLLEAGTLYRIGRYGAFEKNLLVTDAFSKAMETLDEM